MTRETLRLTPSPFRMKTSVIEYEIETWYCCRPWEIVVASKTWDESIDGWKREAWGVRPCGLCNGFPRPVEQ